VTSSESLSTKPTITSGTNDIPLSTAPGTDAIRSAWAEHGSLYLALCIA
jgi:hypothetical protein